jgi:cardiolipin synthase
MDQLILTPSLRRKTLLEVLSSARRSVVLSLFRCDDSRVLDEIVTTARRNVQVKVLITPRARGWNKRLGTLVTLLRHTGVQVKQYDGPWAKYHAKYIVVDETIATVGSMNLTRKCFEETCDFLLLSRNPGLVRDLTKLFESDWSHPFVSAPEVCGGLIVGPDRLRDFMLRLLRQAKGRIRIIDHRVTHPEILLVLAEKMREGVNVRILGRGEVGDLVSHGKLVLIDDDTAVIGSASLSRPGLDVRREVSILLREPDLVGQLGRFFEQLIVNRGATPVLEEPDEDEEDDE